MVYQMQEGSVEMTSFANYLTKCLIANDIVEKEQEEEYIYGFQKLLGKILNYTTLVLLSLYNEVLVPGIIFMIVFFSLRERTGGYHAKTPLRCYLGTVGSYFLMIRIAAPAIMGKDFIYIIIVVISILVIFIFAPVNHPNLLLDEQEIEVCRRSSRWLVILVAGGIWIACVLQAKEICVAYAVVGLGLDAVMILMAKIAGQEVKEHEAGR